MRRAVPLALLVLLAAGCRTPRGTADEPVITGLDLTGVKAVDASDLRERLAAHRPNRLAGFLWRNEWFRLDPDALPTDRKRIEAYYRERGYYHARVDAVDVKPDGEGRVRLVFAVTEGPPVRIRRVTVEGLEDAPAARAHAGALAVKTGAVFTEAAYDRARAQLEGALAATGYVDGKVRQAAQVLPDEEAADVTYQVEPGQRFRFGRVFVAGTSAVPRAKVVAQAARQVTPGEWFDEERLAKVQTNVFDLGVFAGVRVGHGTADAEKGSVPVVVAVREAPFRTIRVGPGLGFQASRWEAQGLATWTHRNWLGGLRRLQLEARAGYAWLPSPFKREREGLVGKLAVDFSQPGVLREVVDVTARVEVERSLELAYASVAERLRLGLPLRLASRWTLIPSYNLEVYQLTGVAGTGPAVPLLLQNCPSQTCLLSYLEQRVAWDGRNDPLSTTRGIYASLIVQEGFPIGGNGYRYLRFQPELRVFVSLGARTVLAARARLGALVPLGETGRAPVVALFTAGGALSMRGYGSERLSPMSFQDGRWVPTGGNGLLEGSLELRQTLLGDLVGALFLDAGNVSEASSSPTEYRTVLDPSRLQLSLGIGIRYRTLFGPLRVDLAGRLPTDWRSGVPFSQRFPEVPGASGHREPIAALHVTLGEAF